MFDPTGFEIPDGITPVPNHGVSWTRKFANWWGGATIASPTMAVVGPAKLSIQAVRRFLPEGIERLNKHYFMEMEYSRFLVRQLLGTTDTAQVIFEASGTSSILLSSRIFAHLSAGRGAKRFFTITTDEGGSLVPACLKGRNPNEMGTTMFQPAAGLFFQPDPVLPCPSGVDVSFELVRLNGLTNHEVVGEIARLAETMACGGSVPGVIVLPHVTKTGRILPIQEMGAAVEGLKRRGIEVYFIVDDIQGVGRMDAESTHDPLSFSDAYVFGSSKALGGLLIASAIIMKEELLARFTDMCARPAPPPSFASAAGTAWVSHFQFEPAIEERLPRSIFKRGAVSLPEVVALREAVRLLFLRGEGETYSQRRQYQLELVRKQRTQVVQALQMVPWLEVLESTEEQPLVPSIVCFKPPKPWSPTAFKHALQEDDPIVTPSACIQRFVRLDIPEYRSMPSIDVLIGKIKAVLARDPAH